MENPEPIITNNSATTPKPRGKGGNTKIILCSIAGALVFLGAFFFVEKQTNLIGLFRSEDGSEMAQNIVDSEVEEEDLWTEGLDSDEEGGEETAGKLKNTIDLAFSGLSDEQYILATALLEDELSEREPDSDYFVFDNSSLAYETAYFDSKDATEGIENVEILSETGFTDMHSESSGSDALRGYSIVSFDIISSNRRKYKVAIDTGGSLSDFKEIKISEQ